MPRLFFAVQTPSTLIKELDDLQYELGEMLGSLKPIPNLKPERLHNSHCTIRFLGNVEESNIDRMIEAVRIEVNQSAIEQFEVSLGNVGIFSKRSATRVIWAGLIPEAPFQRIQSAIDTGLDRSGISFDRERAFHPHVTLFRFRVPYRIPKEFEFPEIKETSPTGWISQVLLIESKTFAERSQHTIRARFELMG